MVISDLVAAIGKLLDAVLKLDPSNNNNKKGTDILVECLNVCKRTLGYDSEKKAELTKASIDELRGNSVTGTLNKEPDSMIQDQPKGP
jgi:hypothetical protein